MRISEEPRRVIQVQTRDGVQDINIYSAEGFRILSDLWTRANWQQRLSYEVTWLGVPIIQLPEDILMLQEIVWKVRPSVIIETGTAHGGTAILYASMLELLGRGRVISIDVEIRKPNRLVIQAHPMGSRITLVEGSSTDDSVVGRVQAMIDSADRVLVTLDSKHTYAHVRDELEKYAPLVTAGSYIVVFDGIMKALAEAPAGNLEWSADNPALAVEDFLSGHPEFEVDPHYNRLKVTYCPGGFLRRKLP